MPVKILNLLILCNTDELCEMNAKLDVLTFLTFKFMLNSVGDRLSSIGVTPFAAGAGCPFSFDPVFLNSTVGSFSSTESKTQIPSLSRNHNSLNRQQENINTIAS